MAGFSNIGYHNDRVKTPNFDAYAKNGVTLEQHYTFWVQWRCRPSDVLYETRTHTSPLTPLTPGGLSLPLPILFSTARPRAARESG